jgi:hypothetical protein
MHAAPGEKCKEQDITVAERGKFPWERARKKFIDRENRKSAPGLRTGSLSIRPARCGGS